MILLVVDSRSKWREAIALEHATTERTVSALRQLFSRFGIPLTIVTGKGTQLTFLEISKSKLTSVRSVFLSQSKFRLSAAQSIV